MPPGAIGEVGGEEYLSAGSDPGVVTAGDPGLPDGDEPELEYPEGGARSGEDWPNGGEATVGAPALGIQLPAGACVAGIGATAAGVLGTGDIGAGSRLGGVVGWGKPLEIGVPGVMIGCGCKGCGHPGLVIGAPIEPVGGDGTLV